MGLLSLLAAALIVILLLVFSNSKLSPFNISPQNSQNIQTEAQQAMDETAKKAKLEQDQIKNIDLH